MRQRQRAAAVTIAGKPHPDFPGNYLPPHDSAYELHQAIIKSGKKGRAEANFWFHGETFLPNDDDLNDDNMRVRVLYLLKLFGEDGSGAELPGEATLLMTTWELKVENEGKTIKEMSCRGEGTDDVTIEVTPL